MYRSMIHPLLLFGISIWGQASKLLINKLLALQKFSRLEIQKRSFSQVGVNIWNKIPENLRKLSKFCFKNQLKTILFNNLKLNGHHVETSKLIFN